MTDNTLSESGSQWIKYRFIIRYRVKALLLKSSQYFSEQNRKFFCRVIHVLCTLYHPTKSIADMWIPSVIRDLRPSQSLEWSFCKITIDHVELSELGYFNWRSLSWYIILPTSMMIGELIYSWRPSDAYMRWWTDRRRAIIGTNAGILLIAPSGPNISEILIEIHTFSFNEMH